MALARKYESGLDTWLDRMPTDAQRGALIECVNELRVEAFSLGAAGTTRMTGR